MSNLSSRLRKAEILEAEASRPSDAALIARATVAALAVFAADDEADVGEMMSPGGPLAKRYGLGAAVAGVIRAVATGGRDGGGSDETA